jgi:hypothetical protein
MQCHQKAPKSFFEPDAENRTKFLPVHNPILHSDSNKTLHDIFVTAFAPEKYCCQDCNEMRAENTAEH